MPFTGNVIHMYVTAGQEVKTGDLLFNIDISGLTEEISRIEKIIKEKERQTAQTDDTVLIKQLNSQIELLRCQLDDKNERSTYDVMFSPADGVISKVNRTDGDKANAASAVIEITVYNSELKIFLALSNNYRYFEAGETIMLKNSRNQDCAGIIRNIVFKEGIKQLEVELDPSSLYQGEQLRFIDSYATENIDYAIYTKAIRIDSNGYYILQLAKEKTSLGEKLFAKRANIYIGITVGEYTEILKGIDFTYPVITNPEIKEGMEIRIY
jgi:hypothetical protein